MSAPLLNTKISPPPLRADSVQRSRLLDHLDAGMVPNRRLVLISAPAGFGKTTLLLEWLNRADVRTAWVSIDAQDNEVYRFLTYLTAALTLISKGCNTVLERLQSPTPFPIPTILAALINQLERVEAPFVILLDDYQFITDLHVHEAMAYLLERLPPQGHLFLASRIDPPFPIARLRARNQLIELRAEDLRFSSQETAQFLGGSMALDLTEGDISVLDARTEGWAAGLQMAAVYLRGRENLSELVQKFSGSHRFILDYLSDEILERLPESVQRFLYRTSILNRLCAPLALAVMGEPLPALALSAEKILPILEYLEAANLFLIPLDGERHWYRYHHLFRDLLLARLMQTAREMLPTLHARASHWFEENGFYPEAIEHAFSAQAPARAAVLIEGYCRSMLGRSSFLSLLHWIQGLPQDLVMKHPFICVMQAWLVNQQGQTRETQRYLDVASQLLPGIDAEAQRGSLQGMIDTLQVEILDDTDQSAVAIELAQRTLARITAPENESLRAPLEWMVARSYKALGELEKSAQVLQLAAENCLQKNDLYTIIFISRLGQIYQLQGKLRQAASQYQQALQLMQTKGGENYYLPGMAFCAQGELLLEWNDLQAAETQFLKGLQLNEPWEDAYGLMYGYLGVCLAKLALGRAVEAEAYLRMAEKYAQDRTITFDLRSELERCRLKLWQAKGDSQLLTEWLAVHSKIEDEEPAFRIEIDHLNLARTWIALEESGRALKLLARLEPCAEKNGRIGRLIEILVLKSWALAAGGNAKAAQLALQKAFLHGQAEGYVRTFLEGGQPVHGLLYQISQADNVWSPYARSLVLASHGKGTELGGPSIVVNPTDLLSQRELEILRLVAEGLSNQEIASRLYLTLGTVKSHIHHILTKLDAPSRTSAISIARERGWL